jgi:hypothetical protein
MKLPPEILSIIFNYLGRNTRDLAQVTGVCKRWRGIAIHYPYLWTSIIIKTRGLSWRQLKRHFSCINLSLDRAGDLLLDIGWHSGNAQSARMFYNLFHTKGTFDRWKTLSLDIDHDVDHPLAPIREVDKFSNLKYLKLVSNPPYSYLDLIGTTATKLHTLELASNFRCPLSFHTEYKDILERITTLNVWSQIVIPIAPLPQNVTNLHVYTMPNLPITHVRHLFVTAVGREFFSAQKLGNLVTLLINHSVEDSHTDLPITLPNLLWLGFKGNAFITIGAFIVPSLHTLSIKCRGHETQTVDGRLLSALWRGFEAPKLLMLFLDIILDGPATSAILRLFPEVSRVDIYCSDAEHGHDILSQVFSERRDPSLCPKLDVLRVLLDVPPSDEIKWKQSVRDTANRIGRPFWLLESKWHEGRVTTVLGNRRTQKIACIHPWVTVE